MFEGGKNKKSRPVEMVRYAELAGSAIVVIYCFLTLFGIIKSSEAVTAGKSAIICLSVGWILMASLGFIIPAVSKSDKALRLVAYHLLAGATLLFVTGFNSPLTPLWLVLTMTSYAFFSKDGLLLDLSALGIFLVMDYAFKLTSGPMLIISDIVAVIVIAITAIVIFSTINLQKLYGHELEHAKTQELLQRDRVMTIINNLADAVISTDENGIVRIYNAASMNLLDTNAALTGHSISEIMPLTNEDGEKVNLLKELHDSKTVTKRDDLLYAFNTDDKMRLEITYSPIRSGYSNSNAIKRDGYILIMRDVTKEKSLEEERDEFISVVSHELRTPIAVAEGTISNVQMMMDHPDVTQKMKNDSLKTAHDQVVFLANMVNDLSTLSRAERGVADNVEDIDLRELANNLHNKYAAEAKANNLQLNLDTSAKLGTIKASRLYLEELLQNLITNALKYTRQGSVTIVIKKRSDNIEFAVKDTGIGISKSDQQKIFNKFYRSEDYRTRETGGTGLGLYIAAKLSHKLGTKIELTSRLNHGSSFSFILPESK